MDALKVHAVPAAKKRVKSKISWQNVHHSRACTHMFLLSFNIAFFFCALFHQAKKMKISAYRTSLRSPPKTRETTHYWFLTKLYCDIFNGVDAILSGRQWNFLTSLRKLVFGMLFPDWFYKGSWDAVEVPRVSLCHHFWLVFNGWGPQSIEMCSLIPLRNN